MRKKKKSTQFFNKVLVKASLNFDKIGKNFFQSTKVDEKKKDDKKGDEKKKGAEFSRFLPPAKGQNVEITISSRKLNVEAVKKRLDDYDAGALNIETLMMVKGM